MSAEPSAKNQDESVQHPDLSLSLTAEVVQKAKNSGCIPISITFIKRSKSPVQTQTKLVMRRTKSVQHLILAMRRRLLIEDPTRMIIFFVENLTLKPCEELSIVYEKYKDARGVLNLTMDDVKGGG